MDPIVAFTGGGTGGHVFPALAIIEELRSRGYDRFLWIGSTKGVEREIVEAAGIPYRAVPAGKLRRYPSLRNVADLFKVVGGFFAARRLLAKERPALLFSKGGFVSVPPVAAARSLGIPVISHESDLDPGLATRLNARSSRLVLTGYAETAEAMEARGARALAVGNPVRRAVREGSRENASRWLDADLDRPLLLVVGGSLGARQLNEIVSAQLERLTEAFTVVHQRGEHPAPRQDSRRYVSRPFFGAEYGDILARADLLLCRGGAGTLWEAAVTRTPAVVIPLSARASRGDQIRNASYFAEAGGVVAVSEEDPGAEAVVDALLGLWADRGRYEAAVEALRTLAGADPARRISDEIEGLLSEEEEG
ncbi:MAG: undecaprenyldiphospho-muramoylpentapeptide beta-N-acetylglucosaminyltransferase [Spirochaetaceae bacterium]